MTKDADFLKTIANAGNLKVVEVFLPKEADTSAVSGVIDHNKNVEVAPVAAASAASKEGN
jgi:hypothetical protein